MLSLVIISAQAFTLLHRPTTLRSVPFAIHNTRAPTTVLVEQSEVIPGEGATTPVPKALPPEAPSTKTLAKFALPALALWLSGPLLSLVDTSAVGLSALPGAGATQIAALGPACTFCDGSIYLFAFLNVATTNLYASARADAERAGGGSSDGTQAVVRRAAKVALSCSAVLVPLLLLSAKSLLALYVGPAAAANPALMNPATTYIFIRCLSFPASLLGGVLTAALLGAKDSVTPLIATAAATVTNIVLDLIGVSVLGYGLAGAAAATLVAQWVCALVLLARSRTVLFGGQGLSLAPAWVRRLRSATAATEVATVPTGKFLVFAAPVLCLILGKIAAYGFLTHAAAGLGAVPLAAHQISLTLFFFLTPFLEVISQTAQTFLPSFGAPPPEADPSEWRTASDRLATRLLGYAVLVSSGAAAIAAAVPIAGTQFLTNDPTVRLAVRPLAGPLAISTFLSGPMMAAEGVLLARRQLKFLALVYLVTTALLPPALIAVKNRGGPVVRVWLCFAAFNFCRTAVFGLRVWGRQLLEGVVGKKAV